MMLNDDPLYHLLSSLAFNFVERYALDMQLVEHLRSMDDDQFVSVAQRLRDMVHNLCHRSNIPADEIMQHNRM